MNHVFELCKKFYAREFGYTGCEFNPPESRRRNGGKDIDMVDMPLAFLAVAGIHASLLDTLNFCPDYRFAPDTNTTAIAPKFLQANASFTKLGQNRYQIAGAKPNALYKAFSLNGQLIESGILNGGVFTAKKLPVILMLNDGRSLYLKE